MMYNHTGRPCESRKGRPDSNQINLSQSVLVRIRMVSTIIRVNKNKNNRYGDLNHSFPYWQERLMHRRSPENLNGQTCVSVDLVGIAIRLMQ